MTEDHTETGAEERALVPVEERSVEFYGDQVVAVLVESDGEPQVYVPLRPICDYLGVAWSAQRLRIKRDPVLAEELRSVIVTITNRQGGDPHMSALPLKYLPGWLFGISAARVKPELREKVIRYQRECYDVLWRAFQADAIARQEVQPAPGPLVQLRTMLQAMVQLVEQQMALESRVDAHDTRLSAVEARQEQMDARLDRAAAVVASLQRRVAPTATITEEQAAEISAAVKALAQQLAAKDPSKNHYQSVFAELYRRFGVSSYKNIARGQFEAVMGFLEEWRQKG